MATSIPMMLLTRGSVRRKLAKKLVITTPNGIAEQRFVRIGGIEQWITIRGEDRANPILLIVHGGPGSVYSVFSPLLRPWERAFTIVQWDQRGAGKTLRRNGKAGSGTISFERLTQDGIELTEYLCHALGQRKIILVGSSVGSVTGVMMVKRRPDLFSAFVGVDQNTGVRSLALSYQITLDWLRAAGDMKGMRAVQRLGANLGHLTPRQSTELHQWTIKANRTIPDMINDIMLPAMLTSPYHSLRDVSDIAKGLSFSADRLHGELDTVDLRALGMRFDVPFFIFQGDTDALTPTAEARAYFDEVEAPHKEFALITRAGHLAAFARPEQFLDELLTRVRPLVAAQRQAV